MVKKSSNSRNSPAPPSSPTGKMVLRVRQNQKMKQVESTEHKVKKKPKSAVKKKGASKIDADKPKKPPTAFFYFLEDFRKDFQVQNPAVKSMRDVGKACGEKWKKMTYEEKVQYYDIATEKRAEFDKAMADYVKRKESGIDTKPEESESESEYEE